MQDLANSLTQKDKIQILLAEYATLRSELITRTGLGFQIGAAIAALLTWLTQQQELVHAAIGAAAVITGAGMFVRVNVRQMTKAAARVRDLEHEINSRAGEHLLVWERLRGAGRIGYLKGAFGRIRDLPRSALPALDPNYRAEGRENSN